MSLPAQTIRTILGAVVLCLCATQVKPQQSGESANSTIRGVVVYADTGHPLRRAHVRVASIQGEGEIDTVSDLRGRFVLENVPAGKFTVVAHAPGILKSDDARVGTTEVVVNGTDSVEVKVRAVRGGVITGRVLTDDDQPVVNADVKLLRREAGKWVPVGYTWNPYREEKIGLKTDASGVYRIAGLPSGEYVVRASEPSLPGDGVPGDDDAYSNGSFMVTYHPAATLLKDAQTISVTLGSESSGIDIRMTERAPHTLTGTVTVTPDNRAAPHAQITIERNDERGFNQDRTDVTTYANANGEWRYAGLSPGDYMVTIRGTISSNSSGPDVYGESLRRRKLVRIRDEKITVLNTRLSAGARLDGRVTFDGKPPEDRPSVLAGVSLVEKDATSNNDEFDDSGFSHGFLREGGEFSMTALAPGTYWFTVQIIGDEKFYVKSVTRKGIDLMQTSFKLADGSVIDDVVVTLAQDLARVEGQVTPAAGAGKHRVGDVMLLIAPANDSTRRFSTLTRTVQTDAQGNFVFKSGPGEFFVTAVTAAEYKKLEPKLGYEYFEKNAEKFARIKLSAGEKKTGLRVPLSQ